MKSQQEENKPTTTTSCEDCIFYTNSNKCSAGRLDAFSDKIITDNPHKIHGICNLKRLESWQFSKEEDALDIARKHVMPLFGIAVFDSEDDDTKILETIKKLKEIDYPKDKIKIVISSKNQGKAEEIVSALYDLKQKFRHCYVDFHFKKDKKEEEFEAFKKLIKASYFVKLEHDAQIPSDVFLMIDDLTNNQMKNAAIFELPKNGSIIMKRVVNSSYPEYNDYDKMTKQLIVESKNRNLYYFVKVK